MEKTRTQNNDIHTVCVIGIISGLQCLLLDCFISNSYISGSLMALAICLNVYNLDKFRWFKSVHICKAIIVNKIYSHDTRTSHSFINFNEKNEINFDTLHTGSNIYYLSTIDDGLYTIKGKIYPRIVHECENGTKMIINAWNYETSDELYEVSSFRIPISDLKKS